jgi:hypothetical protein
MSNSMRPGTRWVHYAASVWSILFAAPHVWWALGVSAGFPGGQAKHEFMMTTPRFYYSDVAVILLCVLAIGVALAPIQQWGAFISRRLLRGMAYTASVMLGLRGLAGLIVDGVSEPIWWPIFLAGGLLFGGIAYTQPTGKTTQPSSVARTSP